MIHSYSGDGGGPRDCRRGCHSPSAFEEAGPEMTSVGPRDELLASSSTGIPF
jgi:hypothetical protein